MLWDSSLFPKLPKNLLASVHREVCSIRSGSWGSLSGKRARIYERGWNAICDYHMKLMAEMSGRGWNFNRSWADYSFRGRHSPKINETFRNDYTVRDPLYSAEEIAAQEVALGKWKEKHGITE